MHKFIILTQTSKGSNVKNEAIIVIELFINADVNNMKTNQD
jgi:hypothetical protein